MNVLLVDDDPVLQRATVRMLPRFQVDAVGGAQEALSAVERSQYAALVVDACLRRSGDDRSGLRLVQDLRARGCPSGIVLVSGVIIDSLEEEAQRVGADVALHKVDYEGSTLRAAIERAIAARHVEGALVVDTEPEGVAQLPPELRPLAQDALDAFAKGRDVEAEQAYRLALLARAARAHSSAKRSGLADCARAIGVSRQTLQPYAVLASRWSPKELKELLARRNIHGEPISVSHLMQLARLPRPVRDAWTERVFAEGLTVRELRDLLRGVPREG